MNYNEAKECLNGYLKARIPFIMMNSVEKERVVRLVTEISNENGMVIYAHSMSKGMYDLKNNGIISSEKSFMGVLSFIANDIKNKRGVTYLLTDIQDIDVDNNISNYLLDIVSLAEERSNSIIVINDKTIWNNLRRLGMSINLEYPNENEILNILHGYIDKYRNQITVEWDENNFKEASVVLLGLSEAEIKNIISIFLARGSVLKSDLTDLKFAKSDLFENIDGLEIVSTEDVVYTGLKSLRSYLNSKRKLFDVNKKEELKKKGIKTPRGILVVGVPGCGKSLTAKAVAKEWNLPLYLLDFATVQGMYVGQSEEQLRNALKTAEHVSPCVLWIDEIEKGLGSKDSSGVTTKMIGQFLYWLQECEKEVFVVATANEVESLPAELLRKGRFDEIFFVDLPNDEERKELIKVYSNKYLQINIDDNFMSSLVNITSGFASSDIEAVIRDLAYNVCSDGIILDAQSIYDTFKNATSISKTNPEKVDKIRNWGKGRSKMAS